MAATDEQNAENRETPGRKDGSLFHCGTNTDCRPDKT